MSIVVSDTSPIRALAHLQLVGLLGVLFGEVLVPPAVRDELGSPHSRFKPIGLGKWPFIQVRAPRDRASVRDLLATLHLGEAEAIVLAGEAC